MQRCPSCQKETTTAAKFCYSLGVILYELLTGRTPFQEPSYLGYLVAHQRKLPAAPRELNPAISEATEQVVLRCLAKKSSERFASAKAMREALARCLRLLPAAHAAQTRLQTPRQSTVIEAPKPVPTLPVAPVIAPHSLLAAAQEVAPEPEPRRLSRWLAPAAVFGVVGAVLYFLVP